MQFCLCSYQSPVPRIKLAVHESLFCSICPAAKSDQLMRNSDPEIDRHKADGIKWSLSSNLILPYLFYVIGPFRLCKNGLMISFSGQTTYSQRSGRDTMAGVLELIRVSQPKRRLLGVSKKTPWVDPKVLELQAAKEILAEVFGMRISEVEEMLLQHAEARPARPWACPPAPSRPRICAASSCPATGA